MHAFRTGRPCTLEMVSSGPMMTEVQQLNLTVRSHIPDPRLYLASNTAVARATRVENREFFAGKAHSPTPKQHPIKALSIQEAFARAALPVQLSTDAQQWQMLVLWTLAYLEYLTVSEQSAQGPGSCPEVLTCRAACTSGRFR